MSPATQTHSYGEVVVWAETTVEGEGEADPQTFAPSVQSATCWRVTHWARHPSTILQLEYASVEAVSDRRFAIAITLLVLTVSEPDDDADLARELGDGRAVAAYIISLVMIRTMWCNARRRDRSRPAAFGPGVGIGRSVQRARTIARHRAVSEA